MLRITPAFVYEKQRMNSLRIRKWIFIFGRTHAKKTLWTSSSAEAIHYALHLRYVPLQAYNLLQQTSVTLDMITDKIQERGVDTMKALKAFLREKQKTNFRRLYKDDY